MKRKKLVRFELLALAAVTLLLAYRVVEGPPEPPGLVVYHDLERNELRRQSFSIDAPTRVSVEAVGSFESADARDGTDLAAYAWVLRRSDREVVWRLDPAQARREKETLALANDTLELTPGTYDVFFTSYGNDRSGFRIALLDRIFGNEETWRDDSKEWRLFVRSANGGDDAFHEVHAESGAELSPQGAGLIWSTAPMGGYQHSEHVFSASERVPIRVYAVGEIDDHPMDYGWIENAVTHARAWEMTRENTSAAGGWDVNRVFDDSIEIDPGVYRAVFKTDPRQNYGDWVGNPPYDPAAWGISLFTSKPEVVREFDPWETHTPIIQIMQVGDDERHSAQFRVARPVQLAAYAIGEMGEGGRYDYAWIRNNDSQETVWEMEYEHTSPAGGDNNRRALAFLELTEGTYTVTYETDDSHSYESWRHGRPEHPERWGVSLFPVAEEFDTTAVEILGYSEEALGEHRPHEDHSPPSPPPPPNLPALSGTQIVDMTGLGNEQRVSREFVLNDPTTLHIRAVGEVSLSGRYDYGWIERAENGEIVWEMTWQNTQPAGGDDINRLFDGPVRFEPGRYVAHFKTDFSHAFGDFDDQAPQNPQAWGMRIAKP